jgi:hypothetical protein
MTRKIPNITEDNIKKTGRVLISYTVNSLVLTHSHTPSHTFTHTRAHTYALTHSRTHTLTRTRALTLTHTHSHPLTHAHTNTHKLWTHIFSRQQFAVFEQHFPVSDLTSQVFGVSLRKSSSGCETLCYRFVLGNWVGWETMLCIFALTARIETPVLQLTSVNERMSWPSLDSTWKRLV